MRYQALLIANPKAKRFSEKRLLKALGILSANGFDVEVKKTSFKGEAEVLSRELSRDYNIIIAAGGDGTFNEVINGLALTEKKMAILPMGTTNVLAKELDIEEDVEGAVMRIINGKERLLSVGSITLQSPPIGSTSSQCISRYFCLMVGIGFDGEAVYGCNETLKRFLGKGAYILSGLKTLLRYAPEPLTFNFDSMAKKGYSAIIGKASKYGGDFKITPDASLFKPDLYIFLMHNRKRMDILRYFLAIISGRHRSLKDITYSRAKEINIEGSAKVQIDGDFIGHTPATIKVIPDAIRMVF